MDNGLSVCVCDLEEEWKPSPESAKESASSASSSLSGRRRGTGPPSSRSRPSWSRSPLAILLLGGRGRPVHDGPHLVEPDRLKLYLSLALLHLLLDVDAILALDEGHELVRVLADDDRPEVAGDVVPGHAVAVVVVERRQTGLVVELLQTLDRHTDVKLGVNGTLLKTLVVVGLSNAVSEKKGWTYNYTELFAAF